MSEKFTQNFDPEKNQPEVIEYIRKLKEDKRKLTGQVKGFHPLVKQFYESKGKVMEEKPKQEDGPHGRHLVKADGTSQTTHSLSGAFDRYEYNSEDFNGPVNSYHEERFGDGAAEGQNCGLYSTEYNNTDIKNSISVIESQGPHVTNPRLPVLKQMVDLRQKLGVSSRHPTDPDTLRQYDQIIGDVLTLYLDNAPTGDNLRTQLTNKEAEIQYWKGKIHRGSPPKDGLSRSRRDQEIERIREQLILSGKKNESLTRKLEELQNRLERQSSLNHNPPDPTAPPLSIQVTEQLRETSPNNIEETTSILVQNNSSFDLASELAALRQQYIVTKDDFEKEKVDKEKALADNLTLKTLNEELLSANEQYKQQLDIFEEDFRHEQNDKQKILSELRRNQQLYGRDEAGTGRGQRPVAAAVPTGRYERVWVPTQPTTSRNTVPNTQPRRQENIHYVHGTNQRYVYQPRGDIEIDGTPANNYT